MIKIAHIINIYRGGVGILESKLAALDSYKDFDITLITPPPPDDLDLPPTAVRHISIPMVRPIKPFTDLYTIWKLYKLFRREQFDIVHTHCAKPGVVGAIAAWLVGVPLIVHTYHGLPFFQGQNKIRYYEYRLFETLICRIRHHVFSQNRRDMAECIRMMRSSNKVSYEGNGVNIKQVRDRAQQDFERANKDFPPGKIRIALVSRLEPVKRVDDFLKVCARLVQDELAISAVIAGCGPLESELREQLFQLGLTEKVRMVGWASHAVSIMAASDIVVLTSEKEGIPRSLMEAMALGKPVVATKVLGTEELVVDGQTGFLTPLGDIEAMADKIKLLSNDAQLRNRFGQAAKSRVEKYFDDIKIAAFLRDFYLKSYQQIQKSSATLA